MKVAVVGATGLVGSTMLRTLEERNFPVTELIPVASERSKGKMVSFKGKEYAVVTLQEAVDMRPDIALFSAGGSTSLEWAEAFAAVGTYVIDNSSAWRMHPEKKLVVPEVNAGTLNKEDKVIANPNCSTIQMVVVLKPLHDKYKIKRVVVSTYQSVTGSGQKGVDHLLSERNNETPKQFYPHTIDLNVLPHIDVFQDNGYTKEEMKMIQETQKIMGDDSIRVSATTVRVPVMGGHSESVNIEFEHDFDLNELRALLENAPGIIVQDDPKNNIYPMPLHAFGKDEVFVGRLRKDFSQDKTLNCWIVADNLRKGAATNAVQIAEYIAAQKWI
ncbi:aspartate-semialdehyde dehydrogenase [Taibaiella lutea]|uniref:Aspartate-semialdehyde dehydrogenase n=1 Tax=Taibaiella lutea TaxID=2608001 RepID=A0A5M6CR48_9BACT|nr:aspartate-semialdehyde dehydrogenase [Taibaiella lutea]KAA5537443.1 aspartate-semialdehyde dehydrogenase [Taibaiella lutea]